jgi:glycine hydroxymethyltransferase
MIDKEIETLIQEEEARQKGVINLIASENYVSKDVLEALGSSLTNKYAEGYPGKRYYGGNEVIDKVERLAQDRALATFGLSPEEWAVNVQPLSGSPANLAVYIALLEQGGKIMGMSLDHGGHLTHGHKASATGKLYEQVAIQVDRSTEMLDYESLIMQARDAQPHIVVSGFTAYPRIIDWKAFRKVADVADAYLMTDMSHIAGLIAGGVYPSPFEYADVVTTTVHKTLRGPRSALIFSKKDHRKINEKINKAVFPGLQGGPHMNQVAAVAVALKEAQSDDFKKYAKQVVKNAQVLADALSEAGWRIVSGGTDSHLLLVDTWMDGKPGASGRGGIGGQEASDRLEKAGIIVNKNTIPFDSRSPVDPSGIRIGTAGETTRGKKEDDFKEIGERIDEVLRG